MSNCTGAYATPEDYNNFWKGFLDEADPEVVADLERHLEIAASDVHQALAAVGACDCTLADWANTYLIKLNIVDAAVMYRPLCGPKLNDDQMTAYLTWVNEQFKMIREGEIILCQGETGKNFPAMGIAEIAYTPQGAVNIINRRIARRGA